MEKNVEMIQPWDRRVGETAAAYRAFQVYLELGTERSLNAAYAARRQEGVKRASSKRASGSWVRWCRENSWPKRAQAWDDFVAKQARDGFADALRDGTGSQIVGEVIEEYAQHLRRVVRLSNNAADVLEKRFDPDDESPPHLGLKDDILSIAKLGEIAGRSYRDLILIGSGKPLSGGGIDDEEESNEAPAPINLRPTKPVEEVS